MIKFESVSYPKSRTNCFEVNSYIAKITKCLCDPCELVRRQTFILLSRLLQVQFVLVFCHF